MNIDEKFMQLALQEAEKAFENDEVPVGAVIVSNNKVIAKAYNQTELLTDVTAHAEIIAITSASNYLGAKYLKNCTLYVTLEPCVMCAGAILWAKIDNLVFGAYDTKMGFTKFSPNILHPKTVVKGGILEERSSMLLKQFFAKKR